jgi:hypothetical protein
MNEPSLHTDKEFELDELLKYSVAMEYAELAAQVTYNKASWSVVHASMERQRYLQVRNQNAQTAGLLIAALLLGALIFSVERHADNKNDMNDYRLGFYCDFPADDLLDMHATGVTEA